MVDLGQKGELTFTFFTLKTLELSTKKAPKTRRLIL